MTERVCDYKLLWGAGPKDLMAEVEIAINFGWQPYGNPFINTHGNHVQAMVLYVVEQKGGPL